MKNSRRTAGAAAAAALATGLVLAGAASATAAPQCISSPTQLEQSLQQAVALERAADTGELAPTSVGRM
ncbi:hypothetical protein ACN2WE_41165 (plasmid) [Streptomyces sp. cg28]|uniref:DUF4148 domain-containing protein n=1 Tax=Streptomyces tabacisoli TaxID=3156398 RepID=A0AAU8J529_9ACTN|nr:MULTISPECIES: hypothetical protein [unclassified Streptomyces]MYT72493.1 hypothetical protein [Streptomyces sp. SID8367]RAJ69427.1 hypothetical protein K377_08072 [Streptomyces sp. PsTaAH-137]